MEKLSTGHVQAALAHMATDYANGVLEIYGSVSQPNDADNTEVGRGNLLAVITRNAGAFTAGQATNGLNLDVAADGLSLVKDPAEVWMGYGTALAGTGATATWFRYYANAYVKGASTSARRFDGAISTADSAELQMLNTTIVTGAPVIITEFSYTPPRT